MYRWVLVRLQNLLGPAVDPNTVCWQTHWKRLPLGHWPSTIFLMPGLPWTQNFSSLGSVTTFLLSRITARFFLVSPQRLVPPYMLGMLRIAMPSRKMLLRSTPTPSHWGTEKKGHLLVSSLYPNLRCGECGGGSHQECDRPLATSQSLSEAESWLKLLRSNALSTAVRWGWWFLVNSGGTAQSFRNHL